MLIAPGCSVGIEIGWPLTLTVPPIGMLSVPQPVSKAAIFVFCVLHDMGAVAAPSVEILLIKK